MSSIDLIPEYYRSGARAAAMALSELDQVLLAAHVNLDGDALGSLAACGYMLKCLERDFIIYSPTGVPHYLDFLDLPGPVFNNLQLLPFSPQCAVYLDCSQSSRLGPQLAAIVHELPSINIDHHLTDAGLGSIDNFIESGAAATSQLMAYVALSMGLPLKDGLAESIALGLMTDTGGFCHGNTTADVFSLCALLAGNGCNIPQLRERLQHNWSLGKVHLWGHLLAKLKLEQGGEIAFCAVDRSELKKFHCENEDLEGLVEWFRKIHGVRVAVLIREEKDDLCKFSLRSFGGVDVSAMAAALGGGGHRNAAGGSINLPLAEGCPLLVQTIKNHLKDFSK